MKQMSDFLPQGYTAPQGGGGYTKLKQGDTMLRILTAPVLGWEDWLEQGGERKPLRYRMDAKPTQVHDKLKHFWAMTVYNYNAKEVQIWQISQSSIQAAIQALASNEHWGNPLTYNIQVTRSGEGLDTTYAVQPIPKSDVPGEVQNAFMDKPVNLEALFSGDDPFTTAAAPQALAPQAAPAGTLDPNDGLNAPETAPY